jgi:hypothetical protein
MIANGKQFITSRPNTPMTFHPTHGRTLSRGHELENGHLVVGKPMPTVQSRPDAVSLLEAKANGSA